MRNGLNKFAKGMFAIFTIKLLFIGTLLIIQSCQTDDSFLDNQDQKLAVDNFKTLVIESKPKLDNYFSKKQSLLSRKSTASEENEMKDILEPLLNGSKDLLHAYNFTDKEIKEELGDLNSPEVILSAVLIVALEKDKQISTASTIDLSSLFATSLYAQENNYDKTVNCVLRATGLAGAGVLLNEGIKEGIKKIGVKGTLKMVGKVAGRTLSWVGVAWAVGDFVYCMNKETK
mgnify:CR=1 FL=1